MSAGRRFARSLAALAGAAAVLLAAAPGASAGALVAAAGSCADETVSKPFAPWGDAGDYFLAPNGGFERGTSRWTLAGATAAVTDNESFRVTDSHDTKSLQLGGGAVATSGAVCVGIDRPSLRFFLRQTGGDATSLLRVDALFEDALGQTRTMTIGTLAASSTWEPSPVVVITPSLLPLLPDARTPVALRFAAVGGTFRVDDIYVDPYGGR